jgi:hypothetical protein
MAYKMNVTLSFSISSHSFGSTFKVYQEFSSFLPHLLTLTWRGKYLKRIRMIEIKVKEEILVSIAMD